MTSIQRLMPKARGHWFPELPRHVLTIVLDHFHYVAQYPGAESPMLLLPYDRIYVLRVLGFWCPPIWILLCSFLHGEEYLNLIPWLNFKFFFTHIPFSTITFSHIYPRFTLCLLNYYFVLICLQTVIWNLQNVRILDVTC